MENPFYGTFTIGQTLQRGWLLYKTVFQKIITLILFSSLIGIFSLHQFGNFSPGDVDDPFRFLSIDSILFLVTEAAIWICIFRSIFRISRAEDLGFGKIIRLARPSDFLYIITFILMYPLMFLSLILLIIPFIYLCNILSIALIVIVIERTYFYGWLPRTWRLVRGRWWKTFALNLIIFVPFMSVILISSLIGAVAGFDIFKAVGYPPDSPTVGLPTEIGTMGLVWIIVHSLILRILAPLVTSIYMIHYNSLRFEKRGDPQIHEEGASIAHYASSEIDHETDQNIVIKTDMTS